MRVPLTEKESKLIKLIKPYTTFDGLTSILCENAPDNVKTAYNEYLEMKKQGKREIKIRTEMTK